MNPASSMLVDVTWTKQNSQCYVSLVFISYPQYDSICIKTILALVLDKERKHCPYLWIVCYVRFPPTLAWEEPNEVMVPIRIKGLILDFLSSTFFNYVLQEIKSFRFSDHLFSRLYFYYKICSILQMMVNHNPWAFIMVKLFQNLIFTNKPKTNQSNKTIHQEFSAVRLSRLSHQGNMR